METTMISAIVLAAGQSRRMGRSKLSMPWGKQTVIGKVLNTLDQVGIAEILVITGGARQSVEEAMQESAARTPVRKIHNPEYATGEMISSVQIGLSILDESIEAALIVLGDQPQMQVQVVRSLLDEYHHSHAHLIVPSYQYRRGHPWIVAKPLWEEIISLRPDQTLRDMLNRYAEEIQYLTVHTPTILLDLDTPEDYQKYLP